MPGAPVNYMPGSKRYDEERIHATIADAEVAVDELADKLGQRLVATLGPALETATELKARMEGTVENELACVEACKAKLRDKLEQRVIDRVTEAYGIAIPLGYQPPSADDLLAATAFSPVPSPPSTQPIPSVEVPDQQVILPSEPAPAPGPGPLPTVPPDSEPKGNGDIFIPTPDGGKICPFGALGDHSFECRIDTDGVWRCYIIGPIAAPGRELCIDWWNIPTECRPPWPEFPWPGVKSDCYLGDPPDDSGQWMGHWLVRGPCHGSGAIVLESCTNGPPPGWHCEAKNWVRNPACNLGPQPPKPGEPPKPEVCKPVCPADFNEKDPVCKPPEPEKPDPPPPPPQQAEGYCEKMDEFLDDVKLGEVGALMGIRECVGGGGTISKAIIYGLTGGVTPIGPWLVNGLRDWIVRATKYIIRRSQCNIAILATIAPYHAVVKCIQQWFGIVPKAALNSFQQMENLACQTVMPDQSSTDSARLADEIKQERWECWTRLNGSVVSAAEVGVQTRRTRPDPLQLCRLRRQEKLTEEEWKKRIRQDGVIKDEDRTAFFDLTQQWPTASDLNPWMIRDVWDNENIDWTEVDKLFEQKFTGESEKLFKAIGWTKDLAKLAWRAHFHLPSFTMVSEMYHRYRHLPEGDPLRTDLEKIRKLLIQDDWHPDWIDRMLAITFRPMRLVDIRNAYNLRVIDDNELQDRLRVLGYDDKTVDITFKFWKRQREIRDARQGGIPSVKQLISKYANCEIDHGTFQSLVALVVETPEQEMYALQAAEIARDSEDARRTIAGISWQYRRGIIDESEAAQHLAQAGIDPTCIPSLVQRMKRQAGQKPKQLAASSLCKMLEYGIITPDEMTSALIRAGFTSQDAIRIMRSCSAGLTVREMRRARAEADRLAREQRRLEREAAKAARLAECGPVPCPANRARPSQNGAGGPSIPGP